MAMPMAMGMCMLFIVNNANGRTLKYTKFGLTTNSFLEDLELCSGFN